MKLKNVVSFLFCCTLLAVGLTALAPPAKACGTFCMLLPCGSGLYGYERGTDDGDYSASVSSPFRCPYAFYRDCVEYPCTEAAHLTADSIGNLYLTEGDKVVQFRVTYAQVQKVNGMLKHNPTAPQLIQTIARKFKVTPTYMTAEFFKQRQAERAAYAKLHPNECSAL